MADLCSSSKSAIKGLQKFQQSHLPCIHLPGIGNSRGPLLPQALVAEKATTTAGLVVSLAEGQDAGLLLRPLPQLLLLRQPGCFTPGLTLGHFFAAPWLVSFRLRAFSPIDQLVPFGCLLRLFNGRGSLTFRPSIIGSLYGRLRRQGWFSGRGKYDPHRR
jgi:hypothetical protein